MSLDRSNERRFSKEFDFIIGLDEAGRGPLAGPVVCAAAFIPDGIELDILIADSKIMSQTDREKSYEKIIIDKRILWEVCVVSHTEIDEINILQASLIGMKRACEALLDRMSSKKQLKFISGKCIALVDGNKLPQNMPIHAVSVIKGDSLMYSVATASIMAKVTRDRIMKEYDTQYPKYNFAQHKGYPTFDHRKVLHDIGPCPIHRISYGPVKLAIQAQEERTIKSSEGKKACELKTNSSSRGRKRKAIDITKMANVLQANIDRSSIQLSSMNEKIGELNVFNGLRMSTRLNSRK